MTQRNYGFKDMRTSAELLLAPGRPSARVVYNKGGLRLDIGAKISKPGFLSKIGQITGSVRNVFKTALAAKNLVSEISSSVTSTLAQFDALKNSFVPGIGMFIPPISTVVSGAFPPAGLFFQFSALRQGSPIPGNFLNIIKSRRNQIQSLKTRIAKLKSTTDGAFGGVTITENYRRVAYPLTDELNIPTGAKQSIGGNIARSDSINKDKAKFVVSGVPTAAGKPSVWSRFTSIAQIKSSPLYNPATNLMFKDRKSGGGWSEPPSPSAPQFPYNKAQQTESGHLFELDDSPGAERVHLFHRSGSFIEMHPNGTVVYKNMKDGYLLTMNDQFVKVSGKCQIAVDGDVSLYAKGNINVQSEKEININTKKDFNVFADNINLRAKKKFKGDGTMIDLRYIMLPIGLTAVGMPPALVPRINMNAIKADFPNFNSDSVFEELAKSPLDPRGAIAKLDLGTNTTEVPTEVSLANPIVYNTKTPAAAKYRSLLFDTPDETEAMDVYLAHCDLQRTLGDIAGDSDPRALSGKLVNLDTTIPPGNADPDYLNFDDYKGNFDTSPTRVLGNTSFTVGDLSDALLYPDVLATIITDTGVVPGEPPQAPNMMSVLQQVLASRTWRLNEAYEDEPDGRGAFTEAAVGALHAIDQNWGHIRKVGGQNQYRGHAVDAIVWKRPDGLTAEIYDIVTGGGGITWGFVDASSANLGKWYF